MKGFLNNFLKCNRELKCMLPLCSRSEVVQYIPQEERQLSLHSGSTCLLERIWIMEGRLEKRRVRNTGDQPPLTSPVVCVNFIDTAKR